MSQKTNPYSLRLQKTNKCFSSSWYSNYFYKEVIGNDLNMRSYIKSIFYQVGDSYEYLFLQNHYKRNILFLFTVDAREIFYDRQQTYRFLHAQPSVASKAVILDKSLSLSSKHFEAMQRLASNANRSKSKQSLLTESFVGLRGDRSPKNIPLVFATKSNVAKEWKRCNKAFIKFLSFKLSLFRRDNFFSVQNFCYQQVNPFGRTNPKSTLRNKISLQSLFFEKKSLIVYNYLHFHSNFRLSPLVSISSIQVIHDFSNASFLLDEILYLLHKNCNFQQIADYILQEAIKLHFIKGIRFSCSGRFGGRSKKAQKSKTQSIQWGESSLHAFSSKVSFANKSVLTPFGKIGVKLWLSFV